MVLHGGEISAVYTTHPGGRGGGSRLQSCCGRRSNKKKVSLLLPGIEPRFSSFEPVPLQIDTVANVCYSINNCRCQLLREGIINENVTCLLVILIYNLICDVFIVIINTFVYDKAPYIRFISKKKTWRHFVGAVSGATAIDLSYSLQCLLHLLFTATLFPSSVFCS